MRGERLRQKRRKPQHVSGVPPWQPGKTGNYFNADLFRLGGVMKSGKIILGGIRYRLDFHEGMVTFIEEDGMSCARITVNKSYPQDLLYVQTSSSYGYVPYAHIKKAVEAAEILLGPNYYASLADMHRNERNIAASHIVKRTYLRPNRKMFWTWEIPFRIASVGRAIRHWYRLLIPERGPRIAWELKCKST